jgi:hypothetical protein
MGKPSAPKSPDPKETAAAQTATNVGTAIANSYLGNVNQKTPYGSLQYTQSGTEKWKDPSSGKVYNIPTWTATQSLSKDQQLLANINGDTQESLARTGRSQASRIQGLLGTPIDTNGLPQAGNAAGINTPTYQQFGSGPQLQTSLGDAGDITKTYGPADGYAGNVKSVEDALMARLQPSLDNDRKALETRLASQGITIGSEGYNKAFDEVDRRANDARYGAILNAGQEQTRLANLDAQKAGFENSAQQQTFAQMLAAGQFGNAAGQQMYQNDTSSTAANNSLADQSFNAQMARATAMDQQRQLALQEQLTKRNQTVNETSALLNGGQVTSPSFMNVQGQSLPNVDYAGMVQSNYQNQMAAYQQQMQQQQGLFGGLLGLGSAFIMSDRDAKKDIKPVGNVYEFRYKGESADTPKHVGVMAQEIEKIRPDVVKKGADGFRRVNYGALFEMGKAA